MKDIGKNIGKGITALALTGTLALLAGSCAGERKGADFRQDALKHAQAIVGDSMTDNYTVSDSVRVIDGDSVFTIYHPRGFPVQDMHIGVPKNKNDSAYHFYPK